MMLLSRQYLDEFVALHSIAVVGVSANRSKFGNAIYLELKDCGKKVFAVNPKADTVEGDPCYPNLSSLPEKPEGVLLVIPPAATLEVIREAASLGIERIWLQQGAESPEGEALCAELGLKLVSGECIFMHD